MSEAVKRRLKRKKKPGGEGEYVSSGSTLLNLALTNHPHRGFKKGHYYWCIGDSNSGKTFSALTCLAEAANDPNFEDYDLIYDNVEDGALMNMEKYFGSKAAERIQAPRTENDQPVFSETVQDMYFWLDDKLHAREKFIAVIDSMDALSSEQEVETFHKQRKAHDAGKDAPGSYGDGKAKVNSQNIRRVTVKLSKAKSVLLIISQTRDNFGFGSMFNPKTVAGGKALKFYATAEMWLSTKGKLKKTVRGKARQIGIQTFIQIKKNRITGQDHSVEIPIYHSTGMDDVGSCVDFLIAEKHWKAGKLIQAPEVEFKGSREKLIQHIEQEDWIEELQNLTGKVWGEIQEACQVKRKSRYS